ncbi:MAG: sugar phosphate isomerase/epimerase [Acidobacteria bacterium]|nr:sugar phosphate isomerase/epimerase [Acidobacteriota bacterium]
MISRSQIRYRPRRRDLGALLLAPFVPAARAAAPSRINGVVVGVQGWSFRDRGLDAAIRATVDAGLTYFELGFNHVEPAGLSREAVREWRMKTPLEEFYKVRRKFAAQGVVITGYSYHFRKDYTDGEFARGFEITHALGAKVLTTTTNPSLVPKLSLLAEKWKIKVGLHNHSRIREDEFATPEDFTRAMAGASPLIGINLDAGHFTAAGFDPLEFLKQHHARTFSVHIKDRKKNQGPDVPFGEGDTPVKEILLLLKEKRYPIPAIIEWEPKSADPVADVRKCYEYCRKVLA